MERKTGQKNWKTFPDPEKMTPVQRFIYDRLERRDDGSHPPLEDRGEASFINSFVPGACPYCHVSSFVRFGRDNKGIQRYRCSSCGQSFKPTTGTIFDSRRIPVSEWIAYCSEIFRYISLNTDSQSSKRGALSTSKYWLEKLLLTLHGSQDNTVLSGTVWLDETCYTVLMRDMERREDGTMQKGLSRIPTCIGIATDKKHTVCLVEGYGKPSPKSSYEAFKDFISEGSTLVHDKETIHKKLVQRLSLKSRAYASGERKGIAESEDPMEPVNRIHSLLRTFLNDHGGFSREDLQGYLDLYAFVINPPSDHMEKIERLIKRVFENPKMLRYRDQFG